MAAKKASSKRDKLRQLTLAQAHRKAAELQRIGMHPSIRPDTGKDKYRVSATSSKPTSRKKAPEKKTTTKKKARRR